MWRFNAREMVTVQGLTNACAMPEPKTAWHHQSKRVLVEGVGKWEARWQIRGEGREHNAVGRVVRWN